MFKLAVSDGFRTAIGSDPGSAAASVRNVAGRRAAPGFIICAAMSTKAVPSLGVDTEAGAKRGRMTTFVDAGSAGEGDIADLRKRSVERAPRIAACLDIVPPADLEYPS